MELDLRLLLEFPSILQHDSKHCQLPALFLWEVSGLAPKFPVFSPGWATASKQLQQMPTKLWERYKHHQALNSAGKPQPEMSHVSHWLQLPAKLFSCRNLLLANPLHFQSLYVCKILQKESSRAQSSIKTFGSVLTCRSEFSRSASSVFSSWAFSFIKSLLWFWLFWRLCFSWLISFSSSSSWEEKQKF